MTSVTPRAQRTEAELKAAARRLLTRKAYSDIKITDITTEAGRAAGSFYRHFADKDALMTALIADFADQLHARVVAHSGQQHTLSSAADVRSHVAAYWHSYREHLPEMIGLFQVAMLSDHFRQVHADLRERHVDVWAGHLADMQYPGDARLTAMSIVCMLEYVAYELLNTRTSVDDTTAINTLTTLISNGVLTP